MCLRSPSVVGETEKDPMIASEPQSRFLRACHRLPVDATPVWFMRQAGRYMAEYRAIREKYSLLEIVQRPEIAAEVTLQPVEAHGVDAAILFADILLPLPPMGMQLEFVKGAGPRIANPFRTAEDLHRIRGFDAQTELGHVMEAIRILRAQLPEQIALIGFCGAPFTVVSYMVEGGPSKDYRRVKSLMYRDPETWHALMDVVSSVMVDYALSQIKAGVQAFQLFDTWAGMLSPEDYATFAQPYSQRVFEAAAALDVPLLHFGTNTATLLPLMRAAGGDVLGLDWRIPLDQGWSLLGKDVAVQGNLDPAALFAPLPVLKEKVRGVLNQARGRPGHIFNLGHGILQHTPPENVKAVVDMVHEWTAA